jgi:hypothetical protein
MFLHPHIDIWIMGTVFACTLGLSVVEEGEDVGVLVLQSTGIGSNVVMII